MSTQTADVYGTDQVEVVTTGTLGPQGLQGIQGIAGPQGITGPAGSPLADGDRGDVRLTGGGTAWRLDPLVWDQHSGDSPHSTFVATTGQVVSHVGPGRIVASSRVVLVANGVDSSHITAPATLPADASAEVRVRVTRPPIPAGTQTRPAEHAIGIYFTNTGVTFAVRNVPNAFIGPIASYATLESQGFPAVGARVDLRLAWDAATDTASAWWRHVDRELDDDAGWVSVGSVVSAGSQLRTSDVQVGSGQILNSFNGDIFRWWRKVNGVVDVDINVARDTLPHRADDVAVVDAPGYTSQTTVEGLLMEIGPHRIGVGMPEGVVTALVGTTYRDTAATNGAILWVKAIGVGSTGWKVVYGDTGWRQVAADLTGGYVNTNSRNVALRRVGDTVSLVGRIQAPASAPPTAFYTLPAGFRLGLTAAQLDGSAYVAVNAATHAYQRFFMSFTSGVLAFAPAPAVNALLDLGGQWSTTDAWPSVLPGVAA